MKFPHNYRKITANLKISLILVTAVTLLSAIFASPSPDNFDRLRSAVLSSPNDPSAHLLLSQEYLKHGQPDAVERELTLASSSIKATNGGRSTIFPTSSSVLGASLSPLKILEEIKAEPQRIKNEIAFWGKVIVDKPDYRDAYLQLAVLNYQIYNLDKAKEYLQKAKEIDPNFEVTKKLENIFKD